MSRPAGGPRVRDPHDVIVVGAGPAGSTTAYYLARGMGDAPSRRVALLERARFPRDKTCGDAWCGPALDILEEMGVLQALEAEGLVGSATAGGFVSPSGESYVSRGEGGTASGTRCHVIKRVICDERIARRAAEAGADLLEEAAVREARLEADGLWTVTCRDGRRVRGRVLVAADGAASRLARSLGVVTTPPDGVACRQYVAGGTHNFRSGRVLLYPRYLLPGHVALLRHPDDDLGLGFHLLPGGAAGAGGLMELYRNGVRNDPFVQRALGPRAEARERVRVASVRLGGVERSTARQLLVVGDAAGQADPLTGQGIHTAMIAGKLAARTIHEMLARGDLSESACRVYHDRWMVAFGRDLAASAAAARLVSRFPLLLDAAAGVARRKGDAFLSDLGAALAGAGPGASLLRPRLALPLGMEAARQLLRRRILCLSPSGEAAYAARAVEESPRESGFSRRCLIDRDVDLSHLQRGDDPEREQGRALGEIFRHAAHEPAAHRVLVLYGTGTGFSREVAHRICDALARVKCSGVGRPLSPRCVDMADHEIVDWSEVHTCLLVCSTVGDGEPPARARPLFRLLGSPGLDLSHVRYSVLALGDLSYPRFCRAGRLLDEHLRRRGAVPVALPADVDREDPGVIRGWLARVCERLADPRTWEGVPREPPNDPLLERARVHFASRLDGGPAATCEDPFPARLVQRRLLTRPADSSDPEILHVELDVSAGERGEPGAIRWEPGDSLGVIPANCPDEVAAVLEAAGCGGHEFVDLPRGQGRTGLREALLRHLDIKNVSPRLLAALCNGAATPAERDRAAALRGAAVSTHREEREVQDILRDFPGASRGLDAERLAGLLEPLRPRYYAIASSPRLAPDRLCLTVAVVHYRRPGRPCTGLAGTYLADRVRPGEQVPVFVQPNPGFRLPPIGSGRSCVMIGAGCGIAPFRAFLQDLEERAGAGDARAMLEQSGGEPHLLFLACGHPERDFLYRDEWRAREARGVLRLFPAFSRGQRDRADLQDRMIEQGALLWRRMLSGSHFYVCGDAARMAPAVERALREIIGIHGGLTDDQARDLLARMRHAARLQTELWAT